MGGWPDSNASRPAAEGKLVRTIKIVLVAIVAFLGWLAAATAQAGAPETKEVKSGKFSSSPALGSTFIISVKGEVIGNGRGLRLLIQPGNLASRAVRVYSQPSNTLLALLATNDFLASVEGTRWHHEVVLEGESTATVTGSDLTNAEAQLEVGPRPSGDTGIQVWMYARWPSGAVEDRLIADGVVGSGDFAFSGSFPPEAPVDDPTWCCSTQACPTQMCIDCTGVGFTCSGNCPGDCYMLCGRHPCDPC